MYLTEIMIKTKTKLKNGTYVELVINHGKNVNTWVLLLIQKKISNTAKDLHKIQGI